MRDEILHIMHRNHIKEVSGHFIEEWHQKLHNNTTPDDVVICAAYLAFLRGNGDRAVFYRVLEEGGVSRQRLAKFRAAHQVRAHFLWRPQGRLDRRVREFPAHPEIRAFRDRPGKRG